MKSLISLECWNIDFYRTTAEALLVVAIKINSRVPQIIEEERMNQWTTILIVLVKWLMYGQNVPFRRF